MQTISDFRAETLKNSVFTLRVHPHQLSIASNDTVTAVAATGGILWVGTESGRLIRHDTVNNETEEVRGRLGVGRLDNAVWKIFPDPYTRAALIILRNADGYLAHGTGLVRPRWLAKLRGLRCVSATWVRVSAQQKSSSSNNRRESSVVLLGTAFGALFSLTVDSKHEKDDTLTLLWNAPSGERVEGVRVEQVAGKFVATVATSSALYLFSDALALPDLFSDDCVTRIDPTANAAVSSATNLSTSGILDSDSPFPSELHFMTGSSGVASRRFVWAATHGVTHGQVAVRRRRVDKLNSKTDRPVRSTVIADVTDSDTIPWDSLKDKTGYDVPLSCNLSAFHIFVLYPTAIFAFNYISGLLTQTVRLGSEEQSVSSFSSVGGDGVKTKSSSLSNSMSTMNSDLGAGGGGGGSEEIHKFFSEPAAGFSRDVLVDCLWVYTSKGEIARLSVTNEEQNEAWKAAKAMGRFDLAMALAPLVSGGMGGPDGNDATAMFQTREAVLEAQADHAAAKGDWDAAAQLYAKTNRPIESVVLRIVDACWTGPRGVVAASARGETINLRDLGIGSRLETVKHVITYLVRKLDRMDVSSRPMQRTIVATLLVQLYSSQLANETDTAEKEEMRKDFASFLADRHQDLDFRTAVNILSKNGCYEEAWNLAVLSGNVLYACAMSSRRGLIDQSLSLLKNSAATSNQDVLSQLVTSLSNGLAPQAPKRVASAVARALKKDDGHFMDHMTVVQGLARAVREGGDDDKSREAYLAATSYLFNVLLEWRGSANKGGSDGNVDESCGGNASGDGVNSAIGIDRDWLNLATFLFVLHAEFGIEAEAQRSYDVLVSPQVLKAKTSSMSQIITDTIGVILRCALMADFRTLCVYLYQALGLHETAVDLAIGVDLVLAEARVAALGREEVSDSLRRDLWCRVARASEDVVGVVERSKGVLHIEDVLNDMEPFECASERVKSSVAHSLQEHKQRANAAKAQAASALEVTAFLHDDINRVKGWHGEQRARQLRRKPVSLACGHDAAALVHVTQSSLEATRGLRDGAGNVQCSLCGPKVIESLDAAFDHGLSLPIKTTAASTTAVKTGAKTNQISSQAHKRTVSSE